MSINFGYSISTPRGIDLDRNELSLAAEIGDALPSFRTCIACGGCTATCTAGGLTSYNFRMVQTLVRRGEYAGAWRELNKCMLCGKCRLVCPRGIDTRAAIMLIKRKLGDY